MSAQIEELLGTVDPDKLRQVVGGLNSQLESVTRPEQPRPASGNQMMQHQPPTSAVLMSGNQNTHSQPVTVSYIQTTGVNTYQPSNVLIAQPRHLQQPRHGSTVQPVPVTIIPSGMIHGSSFGQGQHVTLPQGTRIPGNGSRVIPQNIGQNVM